ncbi:MAG: CdaR family protein [Defluviitaleaceae bacterium]|nr:CdaR family protein [Defluviitaleaceae bacterium]
MKKTLISFKNILLRNISWKIASFIMAFAIWFFVMNVVDPMRTETVTFDLQLRNEDGLAAGAMGIHLDNINQLRNQTIQVSARGTGERIDALRDSFVAYIDLSTADIISAVHVRNQNQLRVSVNPSGVPSGIEIIGISPSTVVLQLDAIETVEIEVEVVTSGEVADGFIILPESISVSPSVVSVTGPSNTVGTIESLVVMVAVDDATSSISLTGEVVSPMNAAGTLVPLTHLHIESTVDIEVPVFRRGGVQVLQPQVQASPPEGYGIRYIAWSPQTLDVAGEEGAIEALAPILLSPIPNGYVENHTADFSMIYDLRNYLPQGVFLIDPSRHTISVDVFVEPIVQESFTISRDSFQIMGLSPYVEVITEEITVTLSGLQSAMAEVGNITPTAFLGSLDLTMEGFHEVPFIIGHPNGVSIVGEAPMLVVYIGAQDEEDDEYENDYEGIEEDNLEEDNDEEEEDERD